MWDAETEEQRAKRPKRKRGGKVAGKKPPKRADRRARGGAEDAPCDDDDGGSDPEERAKGGRLTADDRRKMPASEFAGGKGHFPINDAKHARLAISGATRSERAGNISAGEEAKIKAKARAKLANG